MRLRQPQPFGINGYCETGLKSLEFSLEAFRLLNTKGALFTFPTLYL